MSVATKILTMLLLMVYFAVCFVFNILCDIVYLTKHPQMAELNRIARNLGRHHS